MLMGKSGAGTLLMHGLWSVGMWDYTMRWVCLPWIPGAMGWITRIFLRQGYGMVGQRIRMIGRQR